MFFPSSSLKFSLLPVAFSFALDVQCPNTDSSPAQPEIAFLFKHRPTHDPHKVVLLLEVFRLGSKVTISLSIRLTSATLFLQSSSLCSFLRVPSSEFIVNMDSPSSKSAR